jgi:hypothetical protein
MRYAHKTFEVTVTVVLFQQGLLFDDKQRYRIFDPASHYLECSENKICFRNGGGGLKLAPSNSEACAWSFHVVPIPPQVMICNGF